MKCPMVIKEAVSLDLLARAGEKAVSVANRAANKMLRMKGTGKTVDPLLLKKYHKAYDQGMLFASTRIRKAMNNLKNL